MDAGPKRPTLAKSTPHLANITERLTPLESQPIRPSTSSLTSPLSEPEETSVRVNDQQLPFSFGGEVKKRKVIKAPPLPEYPPWALSAAVELTLTVALEVNPHGVPERVFIKEGCGDSATDLVVIQYVEQLRFQPSLSRSQGELDWSFRLKR
jgi:TonB family protein